MIGWIRSLFVHSEADAQLVQQSTDTAAKSEETLKDSTQTMKDLRRARTLSDEYDRMEQERRHHG